MVAFAELQDMINGPLGKISGICCYASKALDAELYSANSSNVDGKRDHPSAGDIIALIYREIEEVLTSSKGLDTVLHTLEFCVEEGSREGRPVRRGICWIESLKELKCCWFHGLVEVIEWTVVFVHAPAKEGIESLFLSRRDSGNEACEHGICVALTSNVTVVWGAFGKVFGLARGRIREPLVAPLADDFIDLLLTDLRTVVELSVYEDEWRLHSDDEGDGGEVMTR